jgi:hypothetical protein
MKRQEEESRLPRYDGGDYNAFGDSAFHAKMIINYALKRILYD